MPFDTVLFELEGVLAETAPLRRAALRDGLAAHGVALTDEIFADCCTGHAMEAAVSHAAAAAGVALDHTAIELAALRAERAFATAAGRGLALAPGARELVETLAARVRLGLVTRAGRDVTRLVVELAGWEGLFQVIVTADDVTAPKPSPASYRAALDRLAQRRPLSPERVIALEDGAPGIAAATAAGLRCVAVGPLPAHHALAACGVLPSLQGVTPEQLFAAAGAAAGAVR